MTQEVTVDVNDDIEVSQDNDQDHQDHTDYQDQTLPEIADLADIALGLDDDPDTSIARSVRLHLLSEHQVMGALALEEADADTRHGELHLRTPQDHPVSDLRFRPGLGLNSLLLNLARSEELQRLLVPAQPSRV